MTKEQRSSTMSKIRNKWSYQERVIHNLFKTLKIEHKMHPNIEGSPDVVISNRKTAIFLHGCFWHKCPKHYKNPKSNTTYWIPKIENNAIRDKNNIKLLKRGGWNVIVVWEHEFKNNFDNVLRKLNGVVGIANQRNVDKSKRKII